MEFFRDANYDFLGWRRFWLVVSALSTVAALVLLFGLGQLNIGIDFAGGTQLIVRFAEPPDVERLRNGLVEAGLGAAQIQRFGDEGSAEVLIKTPLVGETIMEDQRAVVAAIERVYPPGDRGLDLNKAAEQELGELLRRLDPEAVGAADADAAGERYAEIADALIDARQELGLFSSWQQLEGVAGVSEATRAALEANAGLGSFAVIGAESVGPQIGSELRTKGLLAVLLSIVGMLVYIWFRFELRFGVGAVIALVHDVIITLGLYALANYEFNLTTIAAFLTVVGYSVNDSVVVFDRVRENLRRHRREDLATVLNKSLNQTLSRTVLTGGSVILVLVSLLVFGGAVIRGFAFVLLVGVLVGTYSTLFVASPIVLIWDHYFHRRRAGEAPAGEARREPAAARAAEPAGKRAAR